jgi:hypothetical protein
MAFLPPDLDRLGDRLATAAATTRDKRRRRAELRQRLAVAGVLGAIAFAVLTPATLAPATRPFALADAVVAPPGCDTPRGPDGFMLKRCEPAQAAQPHRPYAWR